MMKKIDMKKMNEILEFLRNKRTRLECYNCCEEGDMDFGLFNGTLEICCLECGSHVQISHTEN